MVFCSLFFRILCGHLQTPTRRSSNIIRMTTLDQGSHRAYKRRGSTRWRCLARYRELLQYRRKMVMFNITLSLHEFISLKHVAISRFR